MAEIKSESNAPIKNKENDDKKKRRRNRLRGFPQIIWTQIAILNDSDYFKENHSEDDFSILIIATDMRRAALVISKNGSVKVESVDNKKEDIKAALKKADGKIETTLETLMGVITKKVDPVKAVLKRQLKLKGIRKVLKFIKYFKVVSYINKKNAEQKK